MELGARYWLIALTGAIAIHLSLLSLLEHPAESFTFERGILIQLGEGASGSGSPPPASGEDLPEAKPAAPEAMDPQTAAEEAEPTQPEPPPEPAALSEPTPEPKAEPVVAKPKAPAKIHKPKRARSAKPKKRAAKRRPDTKPTKVTAGRAAAGSSSRKAGEGSGGQGAGTGSSGSAAAASSRYTAQIRAWLNRNKRYPAQARNQGQEGSVTVRFTVDRNGRVLSSSIVRSSGHAALDNEVRALMRRGRMPRMPAAMQQSRVTMLVPIRFRLR